MSEIWLAERKTGVSLLSLILYDAGKSEAGHSGWAWKRNTVTR